MLGAYAISKAADMQLVRNLAVEWGPKNVRANAIAPGLVRTDFARALWEDPGIYAKRTILAAGATVSLIDSATPGVEQNRPTLMPLTANRAASAATARSQLATS